jgi:flavodoxin
MDQRRSRMRILVTAASRHDATTEVAHAIATTLKRADIEVDERRPQDVDDLDATTASSSARPSTPVIG